MKVRPDDVFKTQRQLGAVGKWHYVEVAFFNSGGWRKSVGVEPTRGVVRPSLDLKSRRPTGVRSSSLLSFTL